jgi:concanavalin A-like lectin/glucanase superfamily protein
MLSTTTTMRFSRGVILVCSFFALLISSCSKDDSTPAPPQADKTALQAKVTEAQTLYDGTVEGTKPGQYEVGSKAPFKTVLDAAKAVLADANATQTAVNNATAQLQAAMDTYESHYITEILPDNLIGFWKMNGNAADSSGHGNDGVLTAGHAFYGAGTPTLTVDRFGRADMAYHFDHGGNIEVPYSASLNPQQMSISVWLKKDTVGRTINTDTYTITSLNRWNGYKFQLQSANKLFYTVHATNGTDTTYYDRDDETAVLDNETWYHGVVTFKPGEMDFYVNGDLVKSWTNVPYNPITLANPINFVIGQDLPTDKYLTVDGDFQVAWGGFWTGDLDDVMFYNVALTGPQVKSIYDNQKTQ